MRRDAVLDAFDKAAGIVDPNAAPRQPRFVIRSITEILANPTVPKWLLKDILEENVIAIMSGPRGTFKSFIALHWSMLVACAGFQVLIISAEGAGIDRRIRAWLQHHSPDTDPATLNLHVIERRVNFNDDAETLEFLGEVKALGIKPNLSVIDTLSKNSGGLDENSNSESKIFIGRIDVMLRREFGCAVLIPHHTGHGDQGRARGASALEADTDAAYIVKREGKTRIVTVSRERFKDSGDLAPLTYEAQVTDLGTLDEYGQPVTSLVMVPASAEVVSERAEGNLPRGAGQQQLLRVLRQAQAKSDSALVWTLADIRRIGRDAGLTKTTARDAAGKVAEFFMVPGVGGYRLLGRNDD